MTKDLKVSKGPRDFVRRNVCLREIPGRIPM